MPDPVNTELIDHTGQFSIPEVFKNQTLAGFMNGGEREYPFCKLARQYDNLLDDVVSDAVFGFQLDLGRKSGRW